MEELTAGLWTLSLDSWSTRDNIPILGAAIEDSLVEVVEDRGQRHTAEMLAEAADTVIAAVSHEFSLEIVSVVTDGAASMSKMRDLVEERYPDTITSWCSAHLLNLVIQDFFKHPGRNSVLTSVILVLKGFRNVQVLSNAVHAKGLARPRLPCTTRWNSTKQWLY